MFKKWGIIFARSYVRFIACSKNETEEKNPKKGKKYCIQHLLLELSIEEEVTQRPILVTINNHPLASPQSGIAQADVVYEMVAEGNVTRFLALYPK